MTDSLVKYIYNTFNGNICYHDEEKLKYNKNLDKYLNDKSLHLFIDDKIDRKCECLNENEMIEKYKSGNHFESGMLEPFPKSNSISYKTFCIYIEIKVLKYFDKSLDDIIKIINERYK